MRKQKGFSLIELLIVVAIILVIAAIAIPNLLKSRMAANEASAAASMRTVGTANVTYSSTYDIGYAGSLAALGPPLVSGSPDGSASANLIDSTLAGTSSGSAQPTSTKSGYIFTYTPGGVGASASPTQTAPNGGYQLAVTPVSPKNTGTSTFCIDQTNVMLKDITGAAVGGQPTNGGCTASATLKSM